MKLKVITPLGTFIGKHKLDVQSIEDTKLFLCQITEKGTQFQMETSTGVLFISGEMIKQSIFILEN